ncbi:Transcriptional regulator, LysR family [Azospirillum argentinense]
MWTVLHHDLATLRLFVKACELKSLSRASEALNLAVSAASRRIRLLEHDAGMPLLKRRPHGIEPTPAGLLVLRYAHDMVYLGAQLEAMLAEYRSGVRGHVRVYASSSALVERLAADLSRFAAENPGIKLELEERPSADTLDALYHKKADIGVIVGGRGTEGLVRYPYAKDRLWVALPRGHRLADRPSLRFAELLDEEHVALEGGTAVHGLLAERARAEGRFIKVRVQVRSFEVMCQMISLGLGVGVLPKRAVLPLSNALGVELVALDEDWAERSFEICVRSPDALDAPSQRLLDFLREQAVPKP